MPEPQFIELDSVESTMREAADRLAQGDLAPWTTIIARHQTQGRGRHGRSWETAPGDALLATVVANVDIPVERIGLLALGTGVAIAEALDPLGVRTALKWPNDVYIDGRKLAGVLIQTRMDAPVTVSVGIGVNLRSIPPGLGAEATCLAEFVPSPPEPRRLAEIIVRQLQRVIDRLQSGDYQLVTGKWMQRALWSNEVVTVEAAEPVTGRFVGIDAYGRLRLSTPSGERLIAEGDVRRGPRVLD
jgi:BirA family biotin operon repressor/biotin-[acetyl-CoA-carboxylase] ligase